MLKLNMIGKIHFGGILIGWNDAKRGRNMPKTGIACIENTQWLLFRQTLNHQTPIIMVCTGDIKDKKYEIVDIVGALVDDQSSVETSGCMGKNSTSVSVDANAMYLVARLLKASKAKGGDAVIHASFEYHVAVKGTGQLASQVKELFCYGTAVKFVG